MYDKKLMACRFQMICWRTSTIATSCKNILAAIIALVGS